MAKRKRKMSRKRALDIINTFLQDPDYMRYQCMLTKMRFAIIRKGKVEPMQEATLKQMEDGTL